MREQLGSAPSRPLDETTVQWVLTHPPLPRVTIITSAGIPIYDTDECDALDITDLTVNIISMTDGMTGTPVNFQKLMVRIYSTENHTITWGAAFTDGPGALPVNTLANMTLQVGLEYNAALDQWACLASGVIG